MMLNCGARASVMKVSAKCPSPDICLIGRNSIPLGLPSAWIGINTYEMPLCLGADGSVRQRQNIIVASQNHEVHTFCPLTTMSSPSRTPRVRRLARSEPALGSEKPWQ